MNHNTKFKCSVICISLLLSLVFFIPLHFLPVIACLNWKIYDKLVTIETKLKKPPAAIGDILLVVLDNKTLSSLPNRWPYPRSYFATVVNNLYQAKVKIIGFDFIFSGKSSPEDDLSLKESLHKQKNIVLPIAINEKGEIDLSSANDIGLNIPAGIVTKLQDKDDVIRRGITFLVDEKNSGQKFLSWETQLLNQIKHIDLQSLRRENSTLYFHNNSGEKWNVPIDPATGSFLIHFRHNTSDFNRISFCDVLKNDFNPKLVKDKVALIGFLSQTFGDVHYTPLKWLPGITLNANAFLTLYTHSFIKKVSPSIEFIVLLIGIITACILFCSFNLKKALLMITMEIFVFFALSYLFLINGYMWGYSVFPIITILCPFLGRKIFNLICRPQSILFVHKDTSLRNLFYNTFVGLKYKISTVPTNKEVLEVLKTSRPHCIVIDSTNTEMPASQMTKQIKLVAPDINIIIPHPEPNAQQFIHNIILDIKHKHYYIDVTLKEESNSDPQRTIPCGKLHNKTTPSKPHILILDDEKECVDLIKHYLSKRNYSIETAHSGEEALNKIKEHRPDIVILDIRMPGIDGLVVLKSIKSIDKSIVVIMTSAAEDQTIIKETFTLGANYYLIKPFSLQELDKIILVAHDNLC